MNSLFAFIWLVFGSGSDSAVAEIQRRYTTVQDQLKSNTCLRWEHDPSAVHTCLPMEFMEEQVVRKRPRDTAKIATERWLESQPFVLLACPDGGVVMRTNPTDSGKVVAEWRVGNMEAMFVLVRETLPGKRVRETRVYRTPNGPYSLSRIGPSSSIQSQPQIPVQDSIQAAALLDRGTRLWWNAGMPAMDFPFGSATMHGMVVVGKESSIQTFRTDAQTDAKPEFDSRGVKWRLKPKELEPWQGQFLGKRFCQVGNGVCATAKAFVLYADRTSPFGEAQALPSPAEEHPSLFLELSRPLEGPVAMEGFPPALLSSTIPESFQKLTDDEIQAEIHVIDRAYREHQAHHQEKGEDSAQATSWSSSPGYKEQDLTFSNEKLAIRLFKASSGEHQTNRGFRETLTLGYAVKQASSDLQGAPATIDLKSRQIDEEELIKFHPPCECESDCKLGPAFIPWNRTNVHLYATGRDAAPWIHGMSDESFESLEYLKF